jgi:radical SAM protein with 4Fe4S-binding SPASM domain
MISVDGLEKTHNMIRGRTDAFLRTVETIKLAKDIGYNVRVNAVVSKLNAAEMKDLILYIAKLDVDVFSFFLYSPTGRNASSQLDNVIGAFEWKKLISELRENIKPSDVGKLQIAFEKGYYYFNNDRMDFSTYRGRGGGCYHLNSICDYLILLANGDVYPCALLTDKDIPYGNVNRNSIKEILSNRNNIEIYREFEKKSDRCTNCASWNFCKGACKAFVFAHYGKWNRSDPRCSDNTIKEYIPLCPLHKENFFTGQESGYSELVVR